MEGKRHDEEGEKERNVWESESESSENGNGRKRKGKSCKGTLFYSSNLKSNGRNPRCVGFSRSLQQVPRYIVSESEVEASKEGRSLSEFKYACVGYSIYLDNNNNNNNKDAPPPPPPPLPPSAHPKPRPELPVCVGIELLVDKRPADHQTPAHAHTNTNTKQDDRGLPQHRLPKTPHPMGEEFFTRFSRNAGLVASGVARNMRKVGNYVKESIDDILYRRPK